MDFYKYPKGSAMRCNILFLQEHDIDTATLKEQLLRDGLMMTCDTIGTPQNLNEILQAQRFDIFVIASDNTTLLTYAQQLLKEKLPYALPTLFIMPDEDQDVASKLRDLGMKNIIFNQQCQSNIGSFISMVLQKDRCLNELVIMGNYMKDATMVFSRDENDEFIITDVNKAFLDMEEHKKEYYLGKKVKNITSHFGLSNILEDIEEVYNSSEPKHMPSFFYYKDEKREWCSLYLYKPTPEKVSLIASDLSEVKRAHDKATESNRYLQTILNAQQHIIYITNGRKLINTNNAFLNFFGFDTMYDFVKAHEIPCNIFEPSSEPFYINRGEENWYDKVADNPKEIYKVRIRHNNAIAVFVPSVEPILVDGQKQYVVILTDITELESEKEKLRVVAMTDTLTGAFNRFKFNTLIEEQIAASLRYEHQLSVIMFDIDNFKHVNDTYSHQTGDSALKELSDIIHKNIRKSDLFVRWGGDEFLVLLSNTALDNAHKAAQKLAESVSKHHFTQVGSLSCSFGITHLQKTDSVSTFISRVDEALYQAKAAGRDCIKVLA